MPRSIVFSLAAMALVCGGLAVSVVFRIGGAIKTTPPPGGVANVASTTRLLALRKQITDLKGALVAGGCVLDGVSEVRGSPNPAPETPLAVNGASEHVPQLRAEISGLKDEAALLRKDKSTLEAKIAALEQQVSRSLPAGNGSDRLGESLRGPSCPNVGATNGECESGRPWLVIGIPSVARKDGLDYLNPTLNYILDQLPDPQTGKNQLLVNQVRVVVLNNGHGQPHPAFEQAQRRLDPARNPKGRYILFRTNPNPVTEGLSADAGSPNVPGARVRQQTVDMASVVEAGASLNPRLFFLMEDDFRLCPHFFPVLEYATSKAVLVSPEWLALRISYGLAGAVLQGRDVRPLAQYLRRHVQRRPPDHLLVEWFAGERPESREYKGDRPHFAFKFNLLQHFGTVSSLRNQKQGRYAGCFELLDTGSLFEVEVFKPAVCPNEDIWPCPPAAWTEAHPVLDLESLGRRVFRVDHGGGAIVGLRETDVVKSFPSIAELPAASPGS